MGQTYLGLSYFWWLLASMPFYALGEYTSKLFAQTHNWWYVVFGVAGYAAGAFCWYPAMLCRNELLVMDTIWKVLAIAVTATLALVVFHERPTVVQWVGIALVMTGVFLVK